MSAQVSQVEVPRWLSAWWVVFALGALGVIAGGIVIAKPGDSLATLAVISGIFVLVDGIIELAASVSRRTANRGLLAVLGVVSVIVGIVLIRHPIAGVAAVALFIGIWLVAMGVVRFIGAFEEPAHRAWNIIVAIIEVIAGIVIVSSPNIGFATLALLVGTAFIVYGWGMCVLGWQMREIKHAAEAPAPHAGAPA